MMEGTPSIADLSPSYRQRAISNEVRARRDFVRQHPVVPHNFEGVTESDYKTINNDARRAGLGDYASIQTVRVDVYVNRYFLRWLTDPLHRVALTRRVAQGNKDGALIGVRSAIEDLCAGETSWGEYRLSPQEVDEVMRILPGHKNVLGSTPEDAPLSSPLPPELALAWETYAQELPHESEWHIEMGDNVSITYTDPFARAVMEKLSASQRERLAGALWTLSVDGFAHPRLAPAQVRYTVRGKTVKCWASAGCEGHSFVWRRESDTLSVVALEKTASLLPLSEATSKHARQLDLQKLLTDLEIERE